MFWKWGSRVWIIAGIQSYGCRQFFWWRRLSFRLWPIFIGILLSLFVGSLLVVHWFAVVATTFIAVLVPIYYVLKRKRPQNIKALLRLHVFGYLFSFLLVSIHFAQNIARLAALYPRIGNRFVLFLVLSVIVATGMQDRFGPRRKLVRYKNSFTYTSWWFSIW